MNHLADETSPYLLQHKHNPVDWYPWGPVALERAERENKPIFLSIGYSACHWCHVMERESFEDPKIAATLNEHFVCIKVDREERPDVDEIYMAAVQALTGSGGWPMSVFMTPDRRPFFGGTYWPPSDRMGLPGFDRVVAHVLKLWNDERENVDKTAAGLTEHLRAQLAPAIVPGDPELAFVDTFVRQSRSQHDAEHGGFASPPRFAPKFPHAMELAGLLRAHARSGDDAVRAVVDQALHAMAQGGIYDQVGGGFHRYSVDREWLVPHFEKMLYDNALLVPVYAEAWRHGRDPEYARIVRETLDYLLREMRDPAGGFWSATDAESEGVEGKFFVWSEAEFDAVCGADAAMARMRFGVSEGGNWEGHNVLHLAASVEEVAAHFERDVAAVETALARARQALYDARRQRVPPRTDDKVLASWTGLTISALCVGHRTFGEVRWLEAARDAADFVLREMRTAPTADEERRLLRSWRRGDASLAGYLEDHAAMALGLLDLFEADFDPRWLKAAREMLRAIDAHFADASDGSYFFTADDHEQLIARSKTPQDSSVPSGIAMVALAQLRLGTLLGDPAVFERGVGVLRAHHQMLSEWPIACSSLVLALEFALGEPRELVIVAERADDPRALAMLEVARAQFPPHDVIVFVHAGNRDALAALTPIVDGKKAAEDGAQVYVCRGGVCAAPITDPTELAR